MSQLFERAEWHGADLPSLREKKRDCYQSGRAACRRSRARNAPKKYAGDDKLAWLLGFDEQRLSDNFNRIWR